MAMITWTEEAQRWLEDIFEYIAADNPRVTAGRWAIAIGSRHVRILLCGHYRIAYLIKDDGNIDILGVFHGALGIGRYQLYSSTYKD